MATREPSVSVRIHIPAKELIDNWAAIDLPPDVGRRLSLPEVVDALVATADRAKLVKYLRK